jgi:uncharacterized protein
LGSAQESITIASERGKAYMTDITVIKQNLQGEETWRYSGRMIHHNDRFVIIEAKFNRPDMPFHGMIFAEGDRFMEIYFADRWYNIFEIYAREDDALKGWYCNVTRPAVILTDRIQYIDLALDLLVFTDGRQVVLDEDEFDELGLDEQTRQKARDALQELQHLVDPLNEFRIESFQIE